MIQRRITFYCCSKGLPSYQLHQLKRLADYFRSSVTLLNLRQLRKADIRQPLRMLSLASKPGELCQLVIQGNDAELAHMVLTEFIAEFAKPVIQRRIKNASSSGLLANIQSPLPFDFSFSVHSISTVDAATPKPKVIASLVDRLNQQKVSTGTKKQLVECFMAREKVSATVMGQQIALPHIMHESITVPGMAVLSSNAGIEWGSNRGPVIRMIAMVLPKPPQRPVVMAFAHFSQCLLNDDFCEALTTAKTPAVIHAIILNALSSVESLS